MQRPGGGSQGCPLRGAHVRMVVGAGPDAQACGRQLDLVGGEEGTGVWGAPSEVQLGGGARGQACGAPSVTWPAADVC